MPGLYTMRPIGSPLHTGFVAFTSLIPEGGSVAEIGCYAGESTFWILMRAGAVVCVDRWEDYVEDNGPHGMVMMADMAIAEASFNRVMDQCPGRITKLKMDSRAAARQLQDRTFDCVYLDAGHEFDDVSGDILAWMPKVKHGGVLAGHDYTEDRPGVIQAVGDLLSGPDRTFSDGTWVKFMTEELAASVPADALGAKVDAVQAAITT